MSSRSKIYIDDKEEKCLSYWQKEVCFKNLVPPSKVSSLFEVSCNIKLASLSTHYEYLAVVHADGETAVEKLYIIHLKEKRVEILKTFVNPVTVIYFIPDCEETLLICSELKLFYINIKSKDINIQDGHNSLPTNVSYRIGSSILISWNSSEVYLWSWPEQILTKKLNLEPGNFVVEAGHIWESQTVFAAFITGIILLRNQKQNMKEFIIESPSGISMEFTSFSLSSDGEWLIGAGNQAIIVIYSMTSRRVTQVVHLPPINSPQGIQFVKFLPCIHPQYPKTFLIQTSSSIMIADFVNSSIIKVLNSHRYTISNVCISGDGFLLCVTYGNGTSKLYTLLSFFPPPVNKLERKNIKVKEVRFSVMKVKEEETEKKNDIAYLFDETKWRDILEEFEEFPKNYRKHIWVSLMKLPRNYSVLNDILIREKKYKFENLAQDFQNTDSSELETLKNVLECLCCWSPFLSQVESLPLIVLPILRVFDSNILLCFEASMFIMLNWFRLWFEKRLSATQTFISLVENLLHDDAELLNHFDKLKILISKIVHLLMSSAFRQVLTFEEWMILWDHIISKPPDFIICVCASFICCSRQAVLKCSEKGQILQLFGHEIWIPIGTVIKKAKTLHISLLSTMNKPFKEVIKEKVYLSKGVLIPFDVSHPEEVLTLAHLKLEISRDNEPKVENAAQFKENSSWRARENIRKYKEMDHEQLKSEENSCLKHIQETRKRLINKS